MKNASVEFLEIEHILIKRDRLLDVVQGQIAPSAFGLLAQPPPGQRPGGVGLGRGVGVGGGVTVGLGVGVGVGVAVGVGVDVGVGEGVGLGVGVVVGLGVGLGV